MIRRSNSPFQTADKHYTLWKSLKEGCVWAQNPLQFVTYSNNKIQHRNENWKNHSDLYVYWLSSSKHGLQLLFIYIVKGFPSVTLHCAACSVCQMLLSHAFLVNKHAEWADVEQELNVAITNLTLTSIWCYKQDPPPVGSISISSRDSSVVKSEKKNDKLKWFNKYFLQIREFFK